MYMGLLNCLGWVCGFVSYYEHGHCDFLSAWMVQVKSCMGHKGRVGL